MASFTHTVLENYNDMETRKDPRVDTWPFMQSPYPIATILAAYLYFVLKLGPKMMEKRKPMELKGIMVAYNAYQVLFSVFLCFQAIASVNTFPLFFTYSCKNSVPNQMFQNALSNAAWWYFLSKVVELLDTVIFVLRKKQSQVTFLHVYHHSVTMIFSWVYLKFIPGEQGIVIGFLNSFVHVIMYTYYMISAMGPKYQKYLWWKKYMTWIQLTQFCMMLTYLLSVIVMDCKLSKTVTFFFVGHTTIFLYLFADFYRKAYRKPKCDVNSNVNAIDKKPVKVE